MHPSRASIRGPVRERIAAVLAETFPGRLGRLPQREIMLSAHAPSHEEALKYLGLIRQLRSKRDHFPPPQRAWGLGGALGRLTGKRWLNPTVMLFICGHYAEAARVFALTAGRLVDTPLVILAKSLPDVLLINRDNPTQLAFGDLTDGLAVREARSWDAAMEATAEPFARRVWSIDSQTYGAFEQAWRSRFGAQLPDQARRLITGCQLISDYADYPIEDRDYHAAALIADWLSSRTPDEQSPENRTSL